MSDLTKQNMNTLESDIRAIHNLPTDHLVLTTLFEISREIPDNANSIDSHHAEYLAGRFLKGLDLCGELYALAISYEMKQELLKKKEFSNAMIIRASEKGLKTAKEKEICAYADEIYIEAAEKYISAKMFRHLVEEKREAFFKAHYLMRKIVDKNIVTDSVSYVNSNNSEDSTEEEWSVRSNWVKK